MIRRWSLLAALFLCVASLPVAMLQPVRAQEAAPDARERQILIMLRLPAPHLRPNAGYSGSYGDSASRAARRRVALGIAKRESLKLVDGWPMPLLGVDCFVLEVPAGQDPAAILARVSRDANVVWAQPLQTYGALGDSQRANDPLYAVQPAAAWHLADLHRYATGRGVTVAVVDSRVEVAHPDLAGQFAANQDFVTGRPGASEQHGTGIAGVIGAKADNGLGIAGVAPGARLMALRACWQTANAPAGAPTRCDTLSLAKAIHYAIDHGAQVINLSLSGPPDRLLDSLVGIALSRRISVVAAYDAARPGGGFPASIPGVVAVADESLPSRPAAVYGAPGRDVPTTQPGGKWYVVNGSSYAVAHISGLLALVREHRGSGPPERAIRTFGKAVDACATLMRTSADCDCSCTLAKPGTKRR